MVIKESQGEIHLKIVYYGPGQSGKTTNLEKIHEKVNPAHRGKLTTIKTRDDRTLFFDFMQVKMGKIFGLTPKFNIYTVPGQSYYKSTRKLVLAGVDGLVFVADSQQYMMQQNIESFEDLKHALKVMGKSFDNIPLVLQCNKQDLPSALKPEEIKFQLLAHAFPCYPAIAIQGVGIFETLKDIMVRVAKKVESNH